MIDIADLIETLTSLGISHDDIDDIISSFDIIDLADSSELSDFSDLSTFDTTNLSEDVNGLLSSTGIEDDIQTGNEIAFGQRSTSSIQSDINYYNRKLDDAHTDVNFYSKKLTENNISDTYRGNCEANLKRAISNTKEYTKKLKDLAVELDKAK